MHGVKSDQVKGTEGLARTAHHDRGHIAHTGQGRLEYDVVLAVGQVGAIGEFNDRQEAGVRLAERIDDDIADHPRAIEGHGHARLGARGEHPTIGQVVTALGRRTEIRRGLIGAASIVLPIEEDLDGCNSAGIAGLVVHFGCRQRGIPFGIGYTVRSWARVLGAMLSITSNDTSSVVVLP